MYVCGHKRRVEARVQALLTTARETPSNSSDTVSLFWKVIMTGACDVIPPDCFRHLPRKPLLHLVYLLSHFLGLCYFSNALEGSKYLVFTEVWSGLKIPPPHTHTHTHKFASD
jgi:hypothetical protein